MVAAAVMFAVLGAVSILSIGIRFLLAAVLASRGDHPLQRAIRGRQPRPLTARYLPICSFWLIVHYCA